VSRPAQMLASVYDVPLAERKATPLVGLMDVAARNVAGNINLTGQRSGEPETEAPPSKRRTQIWDLHASLHCSIIGTCLTPGELRRLLLRLRVVGAETAGDHDAHMLGVLMAGRPQEGAKLLQKTLDRRHRLSLNRFARAEGREALCALWEDAMAGGDIPGAYWALLTHPLTSNEMARHAFGDVHMLSHLVGATNRADLSRLRELERQNAALSEKTERQLRQLRDGFASRDATIASLNDALAIAAAQAGAERPEEAGALRETIAALNDRLAREGERRARLEERLTALAATLDAADRARREAEDERDALRGEAVLIEAQIAALLPNKRPESEPIDLAGRTIVYIGGRAGQMPRLRELVERCNGSLLHHDGGIEHSAALLPGLVGRADLSLFPVDCVSHDAVAAVKRSCRLAGRPYRALRTSSLACLLAALANLGEGSNDTESL
jgi:hypothetical protein